MALRQIVVAGPHVLCYINNVLIGRVTSFQPSMNTPTKEIRGIDVHYVQEFAPTTVSNSFTIGLIRTAGDGGAQGAGLMPQQIDISRLKYFTVLLVDRRNDYTLFKADFCVCEGESWSVDAKNRMTGQVSCRSIFATNESSSG